MIRVLTTFILLAAIGFVSPVQVAYDEENDIRQYYLKLGERNVSLSSACGECKLIVSELKNIINDSTKLERVRLVLKEMCRMMGGTQEHECMDLIDRVYLILRALGPYVGSPEQFCIDLHLCRSPNIPLGSRAILHILRLIVHSSKANTGNDLLCDECVFAATEMNSLLRNADFQQRLKAEMKHICQMLSSMQQKCDQYIEEYFPSLIQFMQSLVSNPQHFCSQLKVCSAMKSAATNNDTASKKTDLKSVSRPNFSHKMYEKKLVYKMKIASSLSHGGINRTERVRDAACVLCKYGCQSLAEELKKNKEVISSRLSAFTCYSLPAEMAPSCLDFSRIYATSMVLMTIEQYATDDLCIQFGLCTNKTLHTLRAASSAEYQAAVCDACRSMTHFISYEFRQQILQQQVITTVKQDFCPFLPGDLVNQCLDTVDQYIPLIMQRIADYVSGQNFCKELGMCRGNILM